MGDKLGHPTFRRTKVVPIAGGPLVLPNLADGLLAAATDTGVEEGRRDEAASLRFARWHLLAPRLSGRSGKRCPQVDHHVNDDPVLDEVRLRGAMREADARQAARG